MWEMCQSSAESYDWLTGHTPPPYSPSHCLQTRCAQTLRRGHHGNCHFKRVASCNYPLFPPYPFSYSTLCFGLFASIRLFPSFFFACLSFSLFSIMTRLTHYFGVRLVLLRTGTRLVGVKEGVMRGLFKGQNTLGCVFIGNSLYYNLVFIQNKRSFLS